MLYLCIPLRPTNCKLGTFYLCMPLRPTNCKLRVFSASQARMVSTCLLQSSSYMGYAFCIRTTVPSSISSRAHETKLNDLALSHFDQLVIGARPKLIVFENKILHAQAGFVQVGHHRRRPIFEVLNPANFYTGIVYVDPVIGSDFFAVHDQADDQEVAVAQLGSRHQEFPAVAADRVHSPGPESASN